MMGILFWLDVGSSCMICAILRADLGQVNFVDVNGEEDYEINVKYM
jgi:hypothetical protein